MITFIEALHKSKTQIQFGWKREPGAVSYNVYVGLGPAISLLHALALNIPDIPDNAPPTLGRVSYKANIGDVQKLLSLASTKDFTNTDLWFTITFVNTAGSESSLAVSTVVEVPPVGIIPKMVKDDPAINRHGYVFSDDAQRWTKMMGSSSGALIIDSADYYKSNVTTVYTYDGTNLSSTLSYPSDATSSGMPAKLTSYTYSSGHISKIVVTDSTI